MHATLANLNRAFQTDDVLTDPGTKTGRDDEVDDKDQGKS